MRGQNAYKTVQRTRRGEFTWEIEEQMERKYIIKMNVKGSGLHTEVE